MEEEEEEEEEDDDDDDDDNLKQEQNNNNNNNNNNKSNNNPKQSVGMNLHVSQVLCLDSPVLSVPIRAHVNLTVPTGQQQTQRVVLPIGRFSEAGLPE